VVPQVAHGRALLVAHGGALLVPHGGAHALGVPLPRSAMVVLRPNCAPQSSPDVPVGLDPVCGTLPSGPPGRPAWPS
jgi:hypothetical protein